MDPADKTGLELAAMLKFFPFLVLSATHCCSPSHYSGKETGAILMDIIGSIS